MKKILINYKFFDDTEISSFKRLKIKPFQGGWIGIGCQDYICGRIVKSLNVPGLASRPMVLFLNGEYWGIYFLQEKPDERYLDDHFDVDLDQVTIITTWGGGYAYGTNDNFMDLYNYIKANDLSSVESYEYLANHIDIDNFIDYQIFEIFASNLDWPNNNMRCWQEGNGLWQWLFFDGDACLFRLLDEFDAIANATYEGDGYYPTSAEATMFFRKMMENPIFKKQFLSRFDNLMRSDLSYSKTQIFYQEIHDMLSGEIPNQVDRFNYPTSLREWNRVMKHVDRFLSKRVADINDGLLKNYVMENTSIESIYPNPANDLLNVTINSEDVALTEFMIFNIMGQMVYRSKQVLGKGTNNFQLHINLGNSVYYLKAGASNKKFVVVR